MNKQPIMFWTPDGCWLQSTINGVTRSSFMGHIGTPDEVADYCRGKGIAFEVFVLEVKVNREPRERMRQ